jgi:hypothetical protein
MAMADKEPLVKIDLASPVSLKAEIKTEIPKESSGRLLDALTDIFRPFSERRGLRADQIRLQREDVLIEIAKRARVRLKIEGAQPQEVPGKFLIPFMEKASLEEAESQLIDTWAELLATASQNYGSSLVRYVSVLAELSSREVKFLEKMISACRSTRPLSFVNDAPHGFDEWFVSDFLDRAAAQSKTKSGKLSERKVSKAADTVIKALEVPGGLVMHLAIGEYMFQHSDFEIHDTNDTGAAAILESLGLVRRKTITAKGSDPFCFADCLNLSEFGLGFLLACASNLAKKIKKEVTDLSIEK